MMMIACSNLIDWSAQRGTTGEVAGSMTAGTLFSFTTADNTMFLRDDGSIIGINTHMHTHGLTPVRL
jgi:hypothetical protein